MSPGGETSLLPWAADPTAVFGQSWTGRAEGEDCGDGDEVEGDTDVDTGLAVTDRPAVHPTPPTAATTVRQATGDRQRIARTLIIRDRTGQEASARLRLGLRQANVPANAVLVLGNARPAPYAPSMGLDRVLVVEDDAIIGRGLLRALTGQGYQTTLATSGEEALAAVLETQPELVLLDLGLPDLDGLEVCRQVRRQAPAAAIIMVTARADELDVVVGLDAGADDYITKPFRLAELLARIRSQLRRATAAELGEQLSIGALRVDVSARRAWVAETELTLRPKEFDLLAILTHDAGQALSRERIMAEVWDPHWFGSTKTLDIHIASLRRKLADSGPAPQITTLRGVGYRLERT